MMGPWKCGRSCRWRGRADDHERRACSDGVLVPLGEQDRSTWDPELVAIGVKHLAASASGARSRLHGPKQGIAELLVLEGRERLEGYPFYWAALGDLAPAQARCFGSVLAAPGPRLRPHGQRAGHVSAQDRRLRAVLIPSSGVGVALDPSPRCPGRTWPVPCYFLRDLLRACAMVDSTSRRAVRAKSAIALSRSCANEGNNFTIRPSTIKHA